MDGKAFSRGSILCYHGRSLVDAIIRSGSGAFYSHVAVALGDGRCIEAQYGGGVRYSPEQERGQVIKSYAYPGDVEQFIGVLKSYLGVPYDYYGLLNVPIWNMTGRCFDPNLEYTKARFCSTLVADAARRCGIVIAPWKPLHAVDPQDVANHFEGLRK